MSPLAAVVGRYRVTSDPLRTQRRIELAVLLFALVLCVQLVYGAARLVTMASPVSVEPAPDSVQVPPVLTPGAVEPAARDEIISRPLFWASRRTADGAEAAPDPDSKPGRPAELKGVKLVGVFGGGESSGIIALVKDKKRRILLGEELEGWTLESVGGNSGLLTRGGRREKLVLERDNPAASSGGEGGAATEMRSATEAEKPRRAQRKKERKPAAGKAADASPKATPEPGLSLGSPGR